MSGGGSSGGSSSGGGPGEGSSGGVSGSASTRLKVAVTLRAWLIEVWHVCAVPEHAPLQLVNSDAGAGDAVNVTVVPRL